jgi:hypothetical protein
LMPTQNCKPSLSGQRGRRPIKLRLCRRRTCRDTCTKFHGAPIQIAPPMRAYSPSGDRCTTGRCLFSHNRSVRCV